MSAISKLRPPGRWNIEQAFAPREWQWVWKDLLAAYPMWEGRGDPLDISPSRKNGTNQGAEWTAGRAGVGLQFTSTDRIELPDSVGDGIADSGSIVVIWEHDGTTGNGHFFDSRASVNDGWDLWFDSGTITLRVDTGSSVDATAPNQPDAGLHVLVGRYDGANASVWIDGVSGTPQAITGSASRSTTPKFGNQANDGDPLGSGRVLQGVYFFSRALTDQEIRQISSDPFGPIRPRLWGPELATAAGVTGTIAATETDDTMAASGGVLISGAVAATETDDTMAASGAVAVSGTVAVTEADDTMAASGAVAVSGSMAWTEADDTMVAVAAGPTARMKTGTLTATRLTDTITGTRKHGRLT